MPDEPISTASFNLGNLSLRVFGYCIPFLPDFLADHTILGQTDQEKVVEILNRWSQFVAGLRKWERCAFALRYHIFPERGVIEISLLCRLAGDQEKVLLSSDLIAKELSAQLTAFGLPHKRLNGDQLRKALVPFHSGAAVVEVRQHEEVTPLWTGDAEAYTVHPFWLPSGSWLLPFETMLRQASDAVVSIYLEPVILLEDEKKGISYAAQVAQTLADQEIRTFSDVSARRRRDPQAELVGRIYANLLKHLAEPFMLSIQVLSSDQSTAVAIARSIGAATISRLEDLDPNRSELSLPTGFDIRIPTNQDENKAALQCFSYLLHSPWGNQLASSKESKDKQRLVFLAGIQGASSIFRFPISVRGGVPGIAVHQLPPDFEPGPRPIIASQEEIHLGQFRRGGAATIKINDLTRHVLVTGFTGSGKTNTVLYLLDQLWAGRTHQNLVPIPFIVIEAAKKEYRGLIKQPGFEDLLVFTLGDETTAPFRLNPLELLPGVRLEAHLSKLQTCFDAALPQFGILPSIIAESLEMAYRERCWRLTDQGEASPEKIFPTIKDLYAKVNQVVERRGYTGELLQNLRAAITGRIGSLLRGSKGKMFACQRSIPLDILMHSPVILELNDLNQQDKSLTMMFLLMLLREYREQNKTSELQHLTVVEEAHNVLENVKSIGASEIAADTRAKAVEGFSTILAEVRAYGEGIIISDQSPEKLAPDAVRNTNLQIAHQLRHRMDREAIAASMVMDQIQQEYLGKLRVGEAAVFITGYDRATFIQVPNYINDSNFSEPSDIVVRERMSSFREQYNMAYLPRDGCRFCQSRCQYMDTIEPIVIRKQFHEKFWLAQRRFKENRLSKQQAGNWLEIVRVCYDVETHIGKPGVLDVGWCYFVQQINFRFTDYMRNEFEKAHLQVTRSSVKESINGF